MGKGQQTKQGQKEQLRKRLLSLGTAKSKQSCSQASSSALHIVTDNCKESRAGMCSSPYSNMVESVGISILLTSHKQHRINSKHKWRGGGRLAVPTDTRKQARATPSQAEAGLLPLCT